MVRGYILYSDPKWFQYFKQMENSDGWIVHFHLSGKPPANLLRKPGNYIFHAIRKTNKIHGCSKIRTAGTVQLGVIETGNYDFPFEKLGYQDRRAIERAAYHWTTGIDPAGNIFYEVLEELKTCELDFDDVLRDEFDFEFGRPGHRPTGGKSLSHGKVMELLEYIEENF